LFTVPLTKEAKITASIEEVRMKRWSFTFIFCYSLSSVLLKVRLLFRKGILVV